MAVGNVTVTTAAGFIPELWALPTLDFRQANLVNANLVNRDFEAAVDFGDTVHITNVSELSTRTKSASTDVTYETFTETTVDVVINAHKYAAVKVEKIAEVQAQQNLQDTYTKQFGYVLGKDLDTAVNGLYDGASQTIGTLTVGLTEEDLRRGIQYLNDANHPDTERAFVFSPAEMNNLYGIDRLVSQDFNLASLKNLNQQGLAGSYQGVPIYQTTNVEGSNAAGHDNILMHKDFIVLIVQMGMEVVSQYDVDSLADKVVAHQIYGLLELRDTAGVWFASK
jgi:hypothetical protein